jgi:hypothetical protein
MNVCTHSDTTAQKGAQSVPASLMQSETQAHVFGVFCVDIGLLC